MRGSRGELTYAHIQRFGNFKKQWLALVRTELKEDLAEMPPWVGDFGAVVRKTETLRQAYEPLNGDCSGSRPGERNRNGSGRRKRKKQHISCISEHPKIKYS